MGNSKLKEENERLKKELEEDLNKEEKLKEENKKLEEKVKKLTKKINKSKIDLSPNEIQQLMEEKENLNDKYNKLKEKYKKLEAYCNNLTIEKNQSLSYCGQLQLMLLMKMQEMTAQQNLNNFNKFQNQSQFFQNQINGIINNNFNNNIKLSIKGGINNNINNNKDFNNQNNNNRNIFTLVFNIDNKYKYPVAALPEHKLGNIYYLLLNQIGNPNFSNINKLQFFYMSKNVTKHFLNNDDVNSLNLVGTTPIIDVTTL